MLQQTPWSVPLIALLSLPRKVVPPSTIAPVFSESFALALPMPGWEARWVFSPGCGSRLLGYGLAHLGIPRG